MKDFNINIFDLFDKRWALVTAGTPEDFNTMTVSWGSLGTLWGRRGHGRRIATIYIKPIRYTYEYLEKNDYFTISFFPEQYRKDLLILGSKSGRDSDKLSLTELTPKILENGIGFEQADLTFVCKKLYKDDFNLPEVPKDVTDKYYTDEPPHRMYIGEIIDLQ